MVSKNVGLNSTLCFLVKIPNKFEFDEIDFIYSSDNGYDHFIKNFRNRTIEPYSFLVNEATPSLNHPLRFQKESNTKNCFIISSH